MLKIYLDTNYPKNLAIALTLVHEIEAPKSVEVFRTQAIEETCKDGSVIFLFDRSKKGIDIVTEKHFKSGYKVFAFKLNASGKADLFQLALTTIKLWPKILNTIAEEKNPFVITYNCHGQSLKKAKGE